MVGKLFFLDTVKCQQIRLLYSVVPNIRVVQTIVLSSQTEKLGWAAAFSKCLGQEHSPKFFLKIFEHV